MSAEATAAAREAVGTTGTCQVCGRTITLRLDGMPKATHNSSIVHRKADEHGPAVTSWSECHGSRLPPVEFVEAYEAAKKAR